MFIKQEIFIELKNKMVELNYNKYLEQLMQEIKEYDNEFKIYIMNLPLAKMKGMSIDDKDTSNIFINNSIYKKYIGNIVNTHPIIKKDITAKRIVEKALIVAEVYISYLYLSKISLLHDKEKIEALIDISRILRGNLDINTIYPMQKN